MPLHEQDQMFGAMYSVTPSNPHYESLCPRKIVHSACFLEAQSDQECICQRYLRLFDHGRMWIDSYNHTLVTGEPYGVDGEELGNFIVEAMALRLAVYLDGRSPWNPGSTLTIRVSRKDCDPHLQPGVQDELAKKTMAHMKRARQGGKYV